MAQFNRRFAHPSRLQSKSQPRRLAGWDPVQPCSWAGCSAQAVSEHKDKVYCASHLLKILQKEWQE